MGNKKQEVANEHLELSTGGPVDNWHPDLDVERSEEETCCGRGAGHSKGLYVWGDVTQQGV